MRKWHVPLRWWLLLFANLPRVVSAGDCPTEGTFSITTQEDADKLSACDTYDGDIIISPASAEDISITGLASITGSLYTDGVNNSSFDNSSTIATSIQSETITNIGANLNISSLPGLYNISLPNLRTVGGPVTFSDLPDLVDLHLELINSVGNLRIIATPQLLIPSIGTRQISTNSSVGLKHITSTTDATIEIRNAGISDLGGLPDFWNVSQLILEDLPNLNDAEMIVGYVGEARISGNGNLTLHMWEGGAATGTVQPVFETLNISGVKHIDPCIWPDVHEFIVINNPVKYLRFGFKALQRLEVRGNGNLTEILPWNGANLYQWNLTDLLIQDNPALKLAQNFTTRNPDDNLTVSECPYMFSHEKDEWEWYPFHMNSVVIDADIDNTFFQSFVAIWNDPASDTEYPPQKVPNSRPAVAQLFNITSADPSFDCSRLDRLRSQTYAFQGNYSCQGHTMAAYSSPSSRASSTIHAGSWAITVLLGFMSTVLLCI